MTAPGMEEARATVEDAAAVGDGGFAEDVDELLVEEVSIDGMCGVY